MISGLGQTADVLALKFIDALDSQPSSLCSLAEAIGKIPSSVPLLDWLYFSATSLSGES
jgi:hypothetical protein